MFVSGCNIILYNLETKEQNFIPRKTTQRRITYLSVGYTKTQRPNETFMNGTRKTHFSINTNHFDIKDTLICTGEYSDEENLFYITVTKPGTNISQYTIKSTEQNWIINFATVLNNSQYCVALSKRINNKKNSLKQSRISFMKYSTQTFVSQETISEDLIYCGYNPKNTIELILCGKGYLRLWNVFINEGTLKEHQQRFLRGKQEKEKTFIKAQFFEKKPFLFIVGTLENVFYIIDSFQVIHELNVNYSYENIYDLNIQNMRNNDEGEKEIKQLKEKIDAINKNNIDSKLREIITLSNNAGNISDDEDYSEKNKKSNMNQNITNYNSIFGFNKNSDIENFGKTAKNEVFNRLYKTKREEIKNEKIIRDNPVKFFELINDNLLYVIYTKDGCSLLYKIEWNKSNKEEITDSSQKKWKAEECRIVRIAKNIKNIYCYSMFKPNNDLILIAETYPKKSQKEKMNPRSLISLYKLKKVLLKEQNNVPQFSLTFEYELFNGFFDSTEIRYIDFDEKKQNIYLINGNNILSCFSILKSEYTFNYPLNTQVTSLAVNSTNNLIAISFPNKVEIYGNLKNNCYLFSDITVEDSIIKWSIKGDFLVIGAKNNAMENMYSVYFVETENFETINVIENITSKIEEIKLVDNDKYLFIRLSSSFIAGMYLNIYNDSEAMIENSGKIISSNYFKLIFFSNFKNSTISCFEYDPILKTLIAIDSINKQLHTINIKTEKKIKSFYSSDLTVIKLVKELNILIGGDERGMMHIFSWPLKNYDLAIKTGNIYDNLLSSLNLDLCSISSLISFKNYSSIITTTSNWSIYINDLLISKESDFRKFEYFQKGIKPQIEIFLPPYIMYGIKTTEIIKKEKNGEMLQKAKEVLKSTMDENIKELENTHMNELDNMKNNLNQNTEDEKNKYNIIDNEIKRLKSEMTEELEERKKEMTNEKRIYQNKCKEKIELYDSEIDRLQKELQQIKTDIENKYNTEGDSQKQFYDKIMTEYNNKFEQLKRETKKSLDKLVNLSCEYNDATDQIVEDYKKLVENLDRKMNVTKERNKKILNEKNNRLEEAKKQEDEHKSKLEEKIKDSDKLIEKNVEIKQNIINATQRTITFQEQLLETEKNLVKIDKKLEDLVIKNKHLEQIRFVLEHRMTSLEKEKAPLEGQCNFLESQKNKLTEEFNRIILQINKNNQELENKQSQLRASLIQNYEVHDQKNYIESKLIQLKKEIEQFLQNYQSSDDEKSLNENKATKVALNFKLFYDKYFSNSIEDELLNYQYYNQKLQEQTDKDGIANNFDLIMRNKAEEKLISEKKKVEELKLVKENGFKRIQNENTILITECNRLRKNLHEIYMHVIDIEQRFETLTNINPKLSKSDIVAQIKEFIRITHEKIKANYAQSNKGKTLKPKKFGKSLSMKKIVSDKDFNKLIEENMNKKKKNSIKANNKELDGNKNNNEIDGNSNPYANLIKLKGYKNKTEAYSSSIGNVNNVANRTKYGKNKGMLPIIGNNK